MQGKGRKRVQKAFNDESLDEIVNDINLKRYYNGEIYKTKMLKLNDYSDTKTIRKNFPACKYLSSTRFRLEKLTQANFFIIRSDCDDDFHKAIKYGVWISTKKTSDKLDRQFRYNRQKGIPLFLVFT